jgi:hypothetical protein
MRRTTLVINYPLRWLSGGRTEFTYTHPVTAIPRGTAPSLLNTSYTISAEVEIPSMLSNKGAALDPSLRRLKTKQYTGVSCGASVTQYSPAPAP